jgi:hypothetical protein
VPPFGVDAKCAYQTYNSPDKDDTGTRGTVDSPVKAVVEVATTQIANFEHRLSTNKTSQTKPFEHRDLSPMSGVVSKQRRTLF